MHEPREQTVLGIGEVLWDCFEDGRRPGGAPANVVYHAGRLGHRALLCSRVGRDEDGDALERLLEDRGLALDLLQRDPELPTGRVRVDLSEDASPRFTIEEPAAWDAIAPEARLEAAAGSAAALCVGTLAQRAPRSRETIRRCLDRARGALTVYDLNLRPPFYRREWIESTLRRARVVKLNDHEARELAAILGMEAGDEVALARTFLADYGAELVCVTRGAAGCLLVGPERVHDEPGWPVTVADTVGAGDAFTAGLISGLLRGWDPVRAARLANRLGACVAGRSGAMPDVADALPALLEEA